MGQRTVLVVEDEPPVREFLTDLLRDEGYEVVEARDGAEAIHVIEQRHPPSDSLSLILLDMMLPKIDGLGVLRHLAAMGAFLPVVAMSASDSHLTLAQHTGAQTVVPKPFDLDQLLDAVARYCAPAS